MTRDEKISAIVEEHYIKYGSTSYNIKDYLDLKTNESIDRIYDNLRVNVRDNIIGKLLEL